MGWRILVCGGRDYNDRQRVWDELDRFTIDEMCHGAAAGADALAGLYAAENGIPCRVFPADWKAHGKAAGALRNHQMLQQFNPEFVIAFPGGRGTAHMVRIAEASGLQVKRVKP